MNLTSFYFSQTKDCDMKATIGSAVLCMGLLSASAQAQMVWKCEVGGNVTYQQSPCEAPRALASHPGAAAANAPLIGTWKEDHALTMAWMRQHSNLSKRQDESLDQRIGHLTYTFTNDRMQLSMPDFDVVIDGVTTHVKGIHDDLHKVVVAASPKMVSVSGADPVTGAPILGEFNFEGHDTVWTPIAVKRNIGFGLDPHYRQYFRRVK
jgi:hypothetical protein